MARYGSPVALRCEDVLFRDELLDIEPCHHHLEARTPVSFLVERLSGGQSKLIDKLSASEAILGEEPSNCQFFQDEHHQLRSISLLSQLNRNNHLDMQ
ncbi:eIF2 kinase Gcn2p negative regulator [Puccinia graminis f. sp. tritici]|uniref:eIF2 kinase Gcn2p negative regulator n=1 Tax=Puccinia graminis f. sp. tritici TaxID=56615 RepID=A0A5B0QV71_PUCGR|nr:eIF2 kinase Gcn2p negative regulator [Puccinia graminis f. sp. tritici]